MTINYWRLSAASVNGGWLGPMVANMTYKYLRFKDKIQESNIIS